MGLGPWHEPAEGTAVINGLDVKGGPPSVDTTGIRPGPPALLIEGSPAASGGWSSMAKSNGKHLVIVESPAKAKTINKYLGDDYVVKASMGHVRDLPSKGMGVDLKTFVPEYEVLESRGKVVSELRKLAKQSDSVYLATDLDREGEAIAWHLKE